MQVKIKNSEQTFSVMKQERQIRVCIHEKSQFGQLNK
jgi:hypothetical protein